ncbi:MAG TPA: hypothetical protein VNL14_09720 [Candidatus Acidoferrales bacterium]|nr:hypothetical protein [Candidatus Acidoferrales bacterium]
MKVLTPAAAKKAAALPVAKRLDSLEGKVWGFVDTSKVNADLFIENLKAEIGKAYRPKDFVVVRKEAPGFPLSSEQTRQLEGCSCVVFCFGD